MDSSLLEADSVTGYSIYIASTNSNTSVSLIVMSKDGEPIELTSNDNVSESRLDLIAEVLDML